MTVRLLPLALIAALALSGCKSAQEKAEDYYRSGMEYLAKGDEERGLLELRNVFRYDGFHKEARRAYADVLIKRGELNEGYGQYLRLIEQYPDTPDVRRILAEMALDRGNWEEARRHGEAALALSPGAPELEPIRISLAYQSAAQQRDEAALSKLAAEAEALLAGPLPDNLLLSRVLIDHRLASEDPTSALPLITAALKRDPKMYDLQKLRYALLARQGDQAAMGAQLKEMAALFPENVEVRNGLVSWHVQNGDAAGAEAYLRGLAGDPKGETAPHMMLVGMLERLQGREAAVAELEALRKANEGSANAAFYGAELARIAFASGRHSEAIADLRAILAGAEASDQTRKIQVDLARYLSATGGAEEARRLVTEVLAADRSNVGALKLRASWAIEADRPGDAIQDLRTALDQAPRDSEVLSMMALAHERDGSMDLAGERLALALEASEGAIPETLRYANFLIRNNRTQLASRVLTDGRMRHPQSAEILGLLSQLYVQEKLWDRALEVVKAMEALPLNDEGKVRVRAQRAAILAGQNRIEESLELLGKAAEDGGLAGSAQLLQAQIRAGRLEEARAELDALRRAQPEEPALKLFDASLSGMEGRPERAEAIWREMLAANPADEPPAQMLYAYLSSTGRASEATAVLDAALAATATPSQVLRWLKAGDLEAHGAIDDSIALYEAMYAEDGSNAVVANNLASLLTAYRSDPESLERAERIARRLRGQAVPAFQDTYGWIAFRRGNLEEAQSHLEPAAAGLPDDALVQMHLGLLYEKLGRRDEARSQLNRALALDAAQSGEAAAAGRARALGDAREALARLEAAPASQGAPNAAPTSTAPATTGAPSPAPPADAGTTGSGTPTNTPASPGSGLSGASAPPSLGGGTAAPPAALPGAASGVGGVPPPIGPAQP